MSLRRWSCAKGKLPTCMRFVSTRQGLAIARGKYVRHASANHRIDEISPVKLAYSLQEPPASVARPGNAIVFIHGLFGSKKNNWTMSKILARDLGRPVYAIDLRNHGDSPHDSRHDYLALAADVKHFLEEHNLKEPTVVGHSMYCYLKRGAKAAMTLALRHPECVANLIPVDNAPVDAALSNDFAKYIQGMRKIEDARVTKQSEADSILKEYEESLPIRQFLLTNLIQAQSGDRGHLKHLRFRVPLPILAKSLNHMADFPFKSPEEARYEKPTLFIRGTRSKYVADETLPAIGEFFPRFEVRDIEAGHWVISENPGAFRDAVVDWLNDKA